MRYISIIIFALSVAVSYQTFAQQSSQNRFVGEVDSSLTIKRVLYLPATDNVGGIYAKPIDDEINKRLESELQWNTVSFDPKSLGNQKWSATLFENNSEFVKKVSNQHKVDAVITANFTKGPSGSFGQLTVYLATDGLPIFEESFKNPSAFEIQDIKSLFNEAYLKLKDNIPYQGLVLSRKGQTVTINMGVNQQIKPNDELSIVHIIKLNRHPKLKIAISNEKEIIGKIKIFKVDSNLSFANIILEKEPGVVVVGSKILGKKFVEYPSPVVGADGKMMEDLSQRPDQEVAFGKNPNEWQDHSRPQYGKVGLFFGNSIYVHNTNLTTVGGVSASSSLAPNISLKGEVWLTSDLTIDYKLRQSVFSITNNLRTSTPESSPRNLNMSINQYGVGLKTSLLMTDDYFGPKWNIGGGFTQTQFNVDDSTPEAYTNNNFGGIHLNLGGQFPISEELPIVLGADFEYFLNKTLSDGKSSGGATADITNFQVYGEYLLDITRTIRAEILFENYSGKMNGTGTRTYPATSTSHRLTTFSMGYNWLF